MLERKVPMSDDEGKSPLDRLTYLNNSNKDRSKRSRKHEDRVAGLVGGKRLAQSGAKPKSKWLKIPVVSTVSFRGEKPREGWSTLDGDIGQKDLWIEHKSTIKNSIALQREWWLKVKDGAASTDRTPAIVITFEGRRSGEDNEDIACIPLSVLRKLMGLSP